MRSMESAPAMLLPSSVLPTPAGPSTRIGFSIFSDRYTVVAMSSEAMYFCPARPSMVLLMLSNMRIVSMRGMLLARNLFLLLLQQRPDLQRQAEYPQESGSVLLVVEGALVKGRDAGIVQGVRRS